MAVSVARPNLTVTAQIAAFTGPAATSVRYKGDTGFQITPNQDINIDLSVTVREKSFQGHSRFEQGADAL